MQPYQAAGEEIKRQGQSPLKIAKGIASAPFAYAGSSWISRALPLLNKYVPNNLARKGLEKINPGFGKFIKKAEENGFSEEEAMDFARSEVTQQMEKQQEQEQTPEEPTKENRNIIEQYSPELFAFINEQMQKGRSPIQAGAIAQNDQRFSSVIKKIMKDHKTPWSAIIETVFGKSQEGQAPAQNQPLAQNQLQQPMQQENAPRDRKFEDRLMAALQKSAQLRGG